MAWTTPSTASSSTVLTAAWLNQYVNDNLDFLATRPTTKASRSTNQSVGNNTWTAVQFTLEEWDTASMFTTGSNTIVTIPITGKYFFEAKVHFANSTSGERGIAFRVNRFGIGLDPDYIIEQVNNANTTAGHTASGVGLFNLAASDTVSVVAWHTHGSSLNVEWADVSAVWEGA